jgi:dihydroorotate dehydrogenase (NAD+) catalytic subunit
MKYLYCQRIGSNVPNQLEVEVAGLKLPNPTMLAAGILGLSGALLLEAVDKGAGAVVTKSIGVNPRSGYANPSVVQVKCGLLNAMGLPNQGSEYFTEQIRELKKDGLDVPIIASVFGFSADEFAKSANLLTIAGADAIELNVSCPHVEKTGSEIGQSPALVREVVRQVRKTVEKPVIVKLTPNVADIVEVAQAAVDAGADAVTAINTVRAMAIDIETAQPILANKVGGLSGSAIKPVAVRCVYEIYNAVDVPIIGCGGVTNWRDAVELLLAGASTIQIGTAIASEGLGVFKSITKGIELYLRKKGFRSVKEIVGLSHHR